MVFRNFRASGLYVVAGLLVFAATGCGPSTYPVKGKVSYPDGSPVVEGMVVFESSGADKPVTARGEIQQDGTYRLSTYQPGDGVPPGPYKVLVTPKYDPNAIDKPQRTPPIHPRYSSFETSLLTFEVKAGENDFPITVTKAGK
jgi:hypothetical protein